MTAKSDTVLCLRTCSPAMTSYHGFQWPKRGTVTAPDWDPTPTCGHGLHGLLWGEGEGSHLQWDEDAVWLVFEADAASVVDLGGKVKVPSARVCKVGTRDVVTAWLAERAPGRAIVGHAATAGDDGTATAGDGGTATAGDRGTATAGDGGTATAGDGGTAVTGVCGTATAGYRGTAAAGDEGVITIRRWDGNGKRTPGEINKTPDANGMPLKPDTPYRLNDDGQFVEATS